MNKHCVGWVFVVFCLFIGASIVCTAENSLAASRGETESVRSTMLFGQPVEVSIAGGGSLPAGKGLTILNASFADKSHAKLGYTGPDIFQQSWFAKFRYGISNHLELSATVPYIHMRNHPAPSNAREYTGGLADIATGLSIAPWNEHQGDPVSASLYMGAFLPTGQYGAAHLPGNGVWGGRLAAGIGKWLTRDFKVDTEVVAAFPFARGNQRVKRGTMYQWNANIRHLFGRFDLGLESVLTFQESGTRLDSIGKIDTRNGYKDWFIGPSANVGLDALNMWAGIGVFFPVKQELKRAGPVENFRLEFKIGKLW